MSLTGVRHTNSNVLIHSTLAVDNHTAGFTLLPTVDTTIVVTPVVVLLTLSNLHREGDIITSSACCVIAYHALSRTTTTLHDLPFTYRWPEELKPVSNTSP